MTYSLTMRRPDGSTYQLQYNVQTNRLFSDSAEIKPTAEFLEQYKGFAGRDGDNGVFLRIMLGRNCNFRCKYCCQELTRQVQGVASRLDPEVIAAKIPAYLEPRGGLYQVQFWGGEPLLYFDDIKKFVECLEPQIGFFSITNGKLLKGGIVDWLLENNISMALSWDGPGQSLRGPDVLSDPEVLASVRRIIDTNPYLFQISPVMTTLNRSHAEFIKAAEDIIERPMRTICEGTQVMVDTEHALDCAIPYADLVSYSSDLHKSLLEGINYPHAVMHAVRFAKSLGSAPRRGETRCISGEKHTVAIDMAGNVLACHNFEAGTCHESGDPYKIGSIFEGTAADLPEKPFTALRARQAERCDSCLVRSMCRGGCPYQLKAYEDYNCAANFWQFVPFFGLALAMLTGDVFIDWAPLNGTD